MPLPKLVLASQSPRRRQILDALGLTFSVEVSHADEQDGEADRAEDVATGNARAKAAVVAEKRRDALVIGCDTMVVCDGEILGKPRDEADARRMLRRLSGRPHEVVTGMALFWQDREQLSATRSRLWFRSLAEEEIESYLKTREPWDKAGAYAVQGLASLFVERIEGSYTNIMGLPTERLLRDLESVTGEPPWKWFAR